MVLTGNTLDEILDYLENSITNLEKDTLNNSEFHMDKPGLEQFLSDQYDIRLDNLLRGKNSNIHHLESKVKNKIIQRKQSLFERLLGQFNSK